MKTLETTPIKVNGLKSYSICAHNLRRCKYALNLVSKPSVNLCGTLKAYKFDTFEEAEEAGEAFLKSEFTGIFAHKEFMKTWR